MYFHLSILRLSVHLCYCCCNYLDFLVSKLLLRRLWWGSADFISSDKTVWSSSSFPFQPFQDKEKEHPRTRQFLYQMLTLLLISGKSHELIWLFGTLSHAFSHTCNDSWKIVFYGCSFEIDCSGKACTFLYFLLEVSGWLLFLLFSFSLGHKENKT